MNASSPQAIGIDLGTTFPAVAYLDRAGVPQTVMNMEGDLSTPSVVFFDQAEAVVGREAVKAAVYEPESVAQFAKRDMGKPAYHKPIRGTELPPEVIQAAILQKLKHDAELRLGEVEQAVITVPAFFNEPRRKATMDAGRLAGLDVVDSIKEPTAAAIAFGVQAGFVSGRGEVQGDETLLVYDLGGGKFDVTLMEIRGSTSPADATGRDGPLGGLKRGRGLAAHVGHRAAGAVGLHHVALEVHEAGVGELGGLGMEAVALGERALVGRGPAAAEDQDVPEVVDTVVEVGAAGGGHQASVRCAPCRFCRRFPLRIVLGARAR